MPIDFCPFAYTAFYMYSNFQTLNADDRLTWSWTTRLSSVPRPLPPLPGSPSSNFTSPETCAAGAFSLLVVVMLAAGVSTEDCSCCCGWRLFIVLNMSLRPQYEWKAPDGWQLWMPQPICLFLPCLVTLWYHTIFNFMITLPTRHDLFTTSGFLMLCHTVPVSHMSKKKRSSWMNTTQLIPHNSTFTAAVLSRSFQ